MGRYLRQLTAFFALLAAALAGFNFLVNPYGYFDAPRIAGVNELALGFNHRLLLAKALAVSRAQPASIILGNSRAEAGYDPQHARIADHPAYNLAIGGAGLGQIRRYFLETLAAGRLRHVILALDFTMFAGAPGPQDSGLDTMLLTDETGNAASDGRRWRRLAFVLLSGTASSDSWWSWNHQGKPVAIYRPSGLREEAYDIDQVAREGGARRASLRAETGFLAGTPREVASVRFRRSYTQTMGQLREILAVATKNNIRVTLIINPIHARQTYVIAAMGLWEANEIWKRELTAAVAQSPKRELVALWDFSGIGLCTGEAMPPENDAKSAMRWYRESSHFRRTLGDRVFDRVFGGSYDGACGEFGTRLQESSLTSILAQQRDALARWKADHAQEAAEIDELARQYAKDSAGN